MSPDRNDGSRMSRRDFLFWGGLTTIVGAGVIFPPLATAILHDQAADKARNQTLQRVNESRSEVKPFSTAWKVLEPELYDDFFKLYKEFYTRYSQAGMETQLKPFIQEVGTRTRITIPLQTSFGKFEIGVGVIEAPVPQKIIGTNLRAALQMMPGPQRHFADSQHPSPNELVRANGSFFKLPKGLRWNETESGIMAIQQVSSSASRLYRVDNDWHTTLMVTSHNG